MEYACRAGASSAYPFGMMKNYYRNIPGTKQ